MATATIKHSANEREEKLYIAVPITLYNQGTDYGSYKATAELFARQTSRGNGTTNIHLTPMCNAQALDQVSHIPTLKTGGKGSQ